jgi:hypothetical protein
MGLNTTDRTLTTPPVWRGDFMADQLYRVQIQLPPQDLVDPLHLDMAKTYGLALDHLKHSVELQDVARLLWLRDHLEHVIDLLTSASFTAAERADQILRERD